MIAIYGSGFMPQKINYQMYVGLWFHRERIRYQRAGDTALGIGVSMGYINPGLPYFRAQTDSDQEAQLLKAQYTAAINSRASRS